MTCSFILLSLVTNLTSLDCSARTRRFHSLSGALLSILTTLKQSSWCIWKNDPEMPLQRANHLDLCRPRGLASYLPSWPLGHSTTSRRTISVPGTRKSTCRFPSTFFAWVTSF